MQKLTRVTCGCVGMPWRESHKDIPPKKPMIRTIWVVNNQTFCLLTLTLTKWNSHLTLRHLKTGSLPSLFVVSGCYVAPEKEQPCFDFINWMVAFLLPWAAKLSHIADMRSSLILTTACDILLLFIFSCPQQLNRTPCPLVPLLPLTIRHYRVTLETCDLWDIWSEWWRDMTWLKL